MKQMIRFDPVYFWRGLGVHDACRSKQADLDDANVSPRPSAHWRSPRNGPSRIHTLASRDFNDRLGLREIRIKFISRYGKDIRMDRGFIDFARLHALHVAQAFFVIRAKSNMQYRRVYSHPIDKTTGLRCDQTIMLTGVHSCKDYPAQLRRIKFHDAEHDKLLVFLTNSFDLPALTITQLHRFRWQVELFFKWIKQHLRIKTFYGISENAVKTQIWIAIAIYVLVAIVKKRLKLETSL
jgi:IS4 transposase